jgi:hypothetical protein
MKPLAIILALLAALLPGLAAAQESDGPRAVVETIFALYHPGQAKGDPTRFYSHRLKALSEEAVAQSVLTSDAAMSGQVYRPEPILDPFVPDDGVLIYDLSIGDAVVSGDRAVVTVRYHNFDAPHLISIALVREDGAWKIDDVASFAGEAPWLLSWALVADPYLY